MSTSEVNESNTIKKESPPPLDEPFKNKETAKSPSATPGPSPQNANAKSTKDSTLVTELEHLGESPAYIDCPYCEKRTLTKVEQNSSTQTSLAAAFCCLCCGVITVCIPFLCNWCADIDHHCSECKKQVSHKPHDGPVEARYPAERGQRPSRYATMPVAEREQLEFAPVEQQPDKIEPMVATPPERAHIPSG